MRKCLHSVILVEKRTKMFFFFHYFQLLYKIFQTVIQRNSDRAVFFCKSKSSINMGENLIISFVLGLFPTVIQKFITVIQGNSYKNISFKSSPKIFEVVLEKNSPNLLLFYCCNKLLYPNNAFKFG